MPKNSPTARTNWFAAMTATMLGFGLLFAPQDQTDRIETMVHDLALPGLRLLNQTQSQVSRLPEEVEQLWGETAGDAQRSTENTGGDLQAQIVNLEEQTRQLQSQNARLMEELDQARSETGSPLLAEPGTPLFVPELLEATIVAADDVSVAVQRASAQRIVDVGQTDGVVPADFVVSPGRQDEKRPRLLIDQGDNVGLHADQPVFAGRCVLGKIQQVGRWTSSLVPVTDSDYRGRAQLMRQTERGLVVGPEGILAGDGEAACRLDFIPATEPVAVGDEVYTAVEGTPLPVPMYYGRVTAAKLTEGAPYWDVHVQPAETPENARSVQVLRIILNPARTNHLPPPRELP